MPITFDCPCGKALRVADEHAGRRVKCPVCNVVGVAPSPEPQFEVVEEEPQFEVVEERARARALPTKKAAADDDDDDDSRGYGLAKTKREDNEEKKPRPWGKKKKRRSAPPPPEYQDNSGRSLEGRILNGGVAGGLLAMFLAVVWFVVGLYAGWIYFYPPVLFVLGLISFIKGLTGQE